MLLFLLLPINALDCTLTLTGITRVGISGGSFTVGFASTATVTYAILTITTNWSIDTATQTQSGSFACNVSGNSCTKMGNNYRCNNVIGTNNYVISCSGMNTPRFSGPAQGNIDVVLYNVGNAEVDKCTSQQLSGFTPGSLTQGTNSFRQVDQAIPPTISDLARFDFSFTAQSSLSNGDSIIFEFAGFTSFSNTGYTLSPVTTSVQSVSPSSLILSVTSNEAALTFYTGSISTLIISPQAKPNTINVYTYRGNTANVIDRMSAPFSFTPANGNIQILSVNRDDNTVNTQSRYAITIQITNALSASGRVRLKIPETLGITDLTCSANVAGAERTGTCTQDVSSNVLVANAFAQAPAKDSSIVVNLRFRNVLVSNQVAEFSEVVTFFDTDTFTVDVTPTNYKFTVTNYQPATLGSIQISTSSLQVAQTNNIEFIFTNINTIPINAYILFDVPAESQLISSSSCNFQGVAVSCSFQITGVQGRLTGLFTSAVTSPTSLRIQIVNGFRNPLSLRPTTANGFSMQIFDASNVALDRRLGFGQVAMTQVSTLTFDLTRSNKQNGNQATFTFSITFLSLQEAGALLTIEFQQISMGVISVQVNGAAGTFTPFSDRVTVTIPQVSAGGNLQVSVNNVINPDSFKPTGTIRLSTRTSDNLYDISAAPTTVTLTNDVENTITVQSMVQELGILGEVDHYLFQFSTTSRLTNGCSIKIKFPVQLTTSVTNCLANLNNVQGFSAQSCTIAGSEITISPQTFGSQATYRLELRNIFTNPTSVPTSPIYFTISTQRDGFPMDITNQADPQLQFKISCTIPCRTCGTIKTECSSCYSTSITTQVLLHNKACITACPALYYANNGVCTQCSLNCLECNSTGCTKCDSKYIIRNGVCSLICLENQFDFNGTCTDCNANCKTCSVSSTSCTSCTATQVLYNKECLSSCPPNVFQVGLTCVTCTAPCKECTTSPTSCKSCVSTYYLKGASCVQQCGDGFFTSVDQCVQCTFPCNNCVDAQTCKDCSQTQGSRYFFQGQCLSQCPNNYYPLVNQCLQCDRNCANCSSPNACTSCPTGKYLMSTSCIDACPERYFSSGFVCKTCDASCNKCESYTKCVACPLNTFHLEGKCITACPSKYFINGTDCANCLAVCAECTLASECTKCPEKNYMLDKKCVSTCPTTSYIGLVDQIQSCIACKVGCSTCDSNGCLSCSANYKKLNFECLQACPTGYIEKEGICDVVTKNEQQVISNLQENKYIPVPFTIVSLILYLSVIVAKMQKYETFVPGSLVGLGGLLVIGSWAIIVLLELDHVLTKIEILIMDGAIGAHLLLNIINLVCLKCATHNDETFQRWYESTRINSCSYFIMTMLSFLSFSLTRFIFSRYFGFRFLKCKVDSVEKLNSFNFINAFAILFACIPACVSTVMLAYQDTKREQLFISCIDSFIVTVIFALMLIWEAQKDEVFFEDQNYVSSVNVSNRVLPEFLRPESRTLRKFSFEEQSVNQKAIEEDGEQLQEPSQPKIDFDCQDVNSSIGEFADFMEKANAEQKNQNLNSQDSLLSIFQEKVTPIGFRHESSQFTFNKNQSKYERDLMLENFSSFAPKDLRKPIAANREELDKDLVESQYVKEGDAPKVKFKSLEEQQSLSQVISKGDMPTDEKAEKELLQEQERKRKAIQLQELEKKQKEEEEARRVQQDQAKRQEMQRQELERKQQELQKLQKDQESKIQAEQERLHALNEERLRKEAEHNEKLKLELAEQDKVKKEAQEAAARAAELQVAAQAALAEAERIKREQEEASKLKKEQEEAERQEKLRVQAEQEAKLKQEEEKIRIEQEAYRREQEKLEQKLRLEEEKLKQKEEILQQEEERLKEEKAKLYQEREKEREMEVEREKAKEKEKEASQSQQSPHARSAQQGQINQSLIYCEEDAEDIEWNEAEPVAQGQSGSAIRRVIMKEEGDAVNDDEWEVPTSGFVSQHKTQLRKENPIEEPVNPLKQRMPSSVDDNASVDWRQPPRAFQASEFFKPSDESSDEDWSANQISPSDFNAMNQRFENDRATEHKRMFQTGQGFTKMNTQQNQFSESDLHNPQQKTHTKPPIASKYGGKKTEQIYLQSLNQKQKKGSKNLENLRNIKF